MAATRLSAGRPGGVASSRARAQVRLAVPHQLVVRRPAHQLGELRRRWSRRAARRATCASVLPEQYQSRSWPPGPQPRRSYSLIVTSVYVVPSGRSTLRKVRRIGSCQHTSGLVSSGLPALLRAPARAARSRRRRGSRCGCGRCTRSARRPRRRGSCGSPSSSVSTQSVLRAFARPAGTARVGVELVDERRDPLLVVLVGEVRAERAAAGVGRLLVDAVAALAEDAHVVATSARSGRTGTPGRRRRGRRTRPRHGETRGRLRARRNPTFADGLAERDGYVCPHAAGRPRHRLQHRAPARGGRPRRCRAPAGVLPQGAAAPRRAPRRGRRGVPDAGSTR